MSEVFKALLVLQDHDTMLDQLRHRREHLPARSEMVAVLAEAKQLMPQHQALTQQRAAIAQHEKRIDDEVQLQRAKANDVNTKLYSGAISSSKELQALQTDVDSVRAHIDKLEDDELEQIAARESVEGVLEPIALRLDALQLEVQRCQAAIVAGEHEVDLLIAAETEARAAAASTIDPLLLADYAKRCAQNRGQGVAKLVGGTCQACRLSIPATEVDAIVHDVSGKAWYCDNCGAILVAS